jgi:toxin ParE1/3/4
MTPRVLKTPAAVEDLVEQAVYLAKRSPSAGERFLDAVEESCELLRHSPELGGICPAKGRRLQNVRVWRVKNFEQHLIFYRQIPTGIEIIRVLHGARDIGAILGAE